MYIIPGEFEEFISSDCNRQDFIVSYLKKRGIEAPVISINGNNHIYVKFPLRQYNPIYKIKTVIAHYDRVPGVPGANDNSAAVFCMLEWACKLYESFECHNIRLIFTDGEERGEKGINQQGAYDLAQLFKKLNIVNDDIFVFDCVGRGTVPIICENSLPAGISKKLMERILELENISETIIKKASGGRWFKLPVNYSDNASFIVNGIPAVAITMLPSAEVTQALGGEEPLTWRLLHTPQDNAESLDAEAFNIFFKILDNLAAYKSLQKL